MDDSQNLRLTFAGDLFLGAEYISWAERKGRKHLSPFGPIAGILGDSDIGVLNFEAPLGHGSARRPDVSLHLYNHSCALDFCSRFGFNLLSIANNHILDFGNEAMLRTRELIHDRGLNCTGAGPNRPEAQKPVIVIQKNRRIGFLAMTSDETFVGAVAATDDKPGCSTYRNTEAACAQVENLARICDVVCVSLHWGREYYRYPSPDQVAVAHALVNAGAAFVIGHHPHVIQGIEVFKGSLIMYSLGNLFFSPVRSDSGRMQYRKAITKEFLLVHAEIDRRGAISFSLTLGRERRNRMLVPNFVWAGLNDVPWVAAVSRELHRSDYVAFWEAYANRRDLQLEHETLCEVPWKLLAEFPDNMRSIDVNDMRRNLGRLRRLLTRKPRH